MANPEGGLIRSWSPSVLAIGFSLLEQNGWKSGLVKIVKRVCPPCAEEADIFEDRTFPLKPTKEKVCKNFLHLVRHFSSLLPEGLDLLLLMIYVRIHPPWSSMSHSISGFIYRKEKIKKCDFTWSWFPVTNCHTFVDPSPGAWRALWKAPKGSVVHFSTDYLDDSSC